MKIQAIFVLASAGAAMRLRARTAPADQTAGTTPTEPTSAPTANATPTPAAPAAPANPETAAPTATPEKKDAGAKLLDPDFPVVEMSVAQYAKLDEGLSSCEQSPKSLDCLTGQARLLLRMSANLAILEENFGRNKAELDAITQSKAEVAEDLAKLNKAIYGDSPSDTNSLIARTQTVRNAIQSMKTTIETQTTQADGVVTKINAMITPELDDVKKLMAEQLKIMKDETNKILNKSFDEQQTKLATVSQGIAREQTRVVDQAQQNAKIVQDATAGVKTNTQAMAATAQDLNKGLNKGLDDAEDEIGNANQYSRSQLNTLNSKLTDDISKSFDASKTQGVSALLAASDAGKAQLNSTYGNVQSRLSQQAQTLADLTNQVESTIQTAVSSAGKTVETQQAKARGQVDEFNKTALEYVGKLTTLQTNVATQFDNLATTTGQRSQLVSDLVSTFSQDSNQKLTGAQAKMKDFITQLNSKAGGALEAFGGSVGEQLAGLVSALASVKQESDASIQAADKVGQGLVADAQLASGSEAFKQTKAVQDALNAIGLMATQSQGLVDSQANSVASNFQSLRNVLLSAMEDGARAANDLGVAGQQRLSATQQELQRLLLREGDKMNEKFVDAQRSQGQAVADLRALVAKNIGKTGADVSNLQVALQELVQAGKQTNKGQAALKQTLKNILTELSSAVADMKTRLVASKTSADTATSDANTKIQTAISLTGDKLKQGIENYSATFSNLLKSRIDEIKATSSATANEIVAGSAQASDNINQIKTHLGTVQNMLDSTNFDSEFLGFNDYIKTLATNTKTSVDSSIRELQTAGLTALSNLRNSLLADAQTSTTALSTQTQNATETVSARVNSVLNQLKTLQEAVADAEGSASSQKDIATQSWSTMATKLQEAKKGIQADSAAEMAAIQDFITSKLDSWEREINANVTMVQESMNALFTKTPNITNEKVEAAQAAMVVQQQGMMKTVQELKTKFAAQSAQRASYLQQQSILRLAAILNIDRAAVEAKAGLLSKVNMQGLDQTEVGRRASNIMASIADAIQAENDPTAVAKMKNEIGNLNSSAGILGKHFSTYMGKEFSDVAIDQQNQHATFAKSIQDEATKTGVLSTAIAGQLSTAVEELQDKEVLTSLTLAEDKTKLFNLGTVMAGLSDDSRLKLTKLLHAVRREVAQARQVNQMLEQEGFDKVSSVSKVMAELSNVIDSYAVESRDSFKGVNSDLQAFGTDMYSRLEAAGDHLVSLARDASNSTSSVKESFNNVASRIRSFMTRASKQYNDLLEEKGAMEVRASSELEELQTQAQSVLSRVLKDHQSVKNEIKSWLDSEGEKINDVPLDDAPSVAEENVFGSDDPSST